MKMYVLKDLNDPAKLKTEHRSHPGKDMVIAPIDPITGKHEDPRWLQIESVDIDGIMTDVATVNATLKTATQAEDAALETEKAAEKAVDAVSIDAMYDYLLAFDENSVKDISDIRVFAGMIKSYMLYKYKDEVKKRQEA